MELEPFVSYFPFPRNLVSVAVDGTELHILKIYIVLSIVYIRVLMYINYLYPYFKRCLTR